MTRHCGSCRYIHRPNLKGDPPDGGYCHGWPPQTHRLVFRDATGEHARWQSARPWVFNVDRACELWRRARRWWLLWLA